MTKIQDKITYYDGSTATGRVVVTWPPFDYGGVAVAAGQQEYPIGPDGSVVIECYPCVGAQPIGTYYTATYELDKGSVYDEYWMVPSAPTTTIGAIRVSVPETPSIMINAQQLTSSGAQSGMFLGWNGSNWVPMYVSNFNCAVRSFFGRIGDVMPLAGDYVVAQVTGAVPDTRRIIAGSGLSGGGPLTGDVTLSVALGGFVPQSTQVIAGYGLTGGGPLTGNVTLAVVDNSNIQKLQLALAGALKATRHQLNFVAGSGVNLNLVDDGPNDQGTLLITAVATGAPSPSIFSVNDVQIGIQPELNLIAAANVTLAGVNNTGAGRVDITVSAIGGGVYSVNGVEVGVQPGLNLIADTNVTLAGVNNTGAGRVDITVSAIGGGVYSVNGVEVGVQPGLNLIADTNVTLTGVNNPGAGRVDITVSAIGGGAAQTPWTSDIDAANFSLKSVGPTMTWTPASIGMVGIALQTGGPFGGGIGMIDGSQTIGLFSSFGNLIFANGTTSTGLTGRMTMSAAGLVGIGRAPEVTLDVLGSGVFRAIGQQNATSGQGLRVGYDTGNGGIGDVLSYNWTTLGFMPLMIRGNPVTFPSGRVGIGVDAPSSALQVVGTVTTNILYLAAGTPPGWDTATRIWFENGFGTRYDGYQHRFDVGGARTEAMRIDTVGNVGIGTANPLNKLQVRGAANQNLGIRFDGTCMGFGSFNDAGTISGPLSYNATWHQFYGNVGVGIANPAYKFMVVGGRSMFAAANERYAVGFRYVDGSPVFWQGSDLNGDMIFCEAGGSERMRIKAGTGVRVGALSYTTQSGDLGVARDGSPATGVIYFGNGGGVYIHFDGSNFNLTNTINCGGSIFMSGRLGVGTAGPASRAHIYGPGQDGSGGHYWPGLNPDCELYVQDSGGAGGNGGAVVFGSGYGVHAAVKGFVTNGSGPMGDIVWYLRPTAVDTALFERLRLSMSGLGVQGNVNITGQFQVNGAPISTAFGVNVQINNGQGYGPFAYLNFQQGGSTTITGSIGGPNSNTMTVNIGIASDARLKRNIEPLDGGLAFVNQLRPVTAEWNGLASQREGERVVSVIAQDVQAVIPDAVGTFRTKLRPEDSEETELLSLNTMALVSHLILAVQQLSEQVNALRQIDERRKAN